MKVRILLRKLSFLAKLLGSEDNTMSAQVFRTLSVDNVYKISLVDQYNTLQNEIGLHSVLQQCLAEPALASSIVKSEKKRILEADWNVTLENAKGHESLKYVVISEQVAASWCSVWDLALDHGTRGTKLTQSLFANLCQPLLKDRICHVCENRIPLNKNFFDHLCVTHLKRRYNDHIASILEESMWAITDVNP